MREVPEGQFVSLALSGDACQSVKGHVDALVLKPVAERVASKVRVDTVP